MLPASRPLRLDRGHHAQARSRSRRRIRSRVRPRRLRLRGREGADRGSAAAEARRRREDAEGIQAAAEEVEEGRARREGAGGPRRQRLASLPNQAGPSAWCLAAVSTRILFVSGSILYWKRQSSMWSTSQLLVRDSHNTLPLGMALSEPITSSMRAKSVAPMSRGTSLNRSANPSDRLHILREL